MSIDVTALDLSRPVALPLASGQVVTLRGEMRTSFDGTKYDAVTRYDDAGEHLGGLVAIEGVGLRLAKRAHGNVELEATGAHAPLCDALHLAAPCLVPRTSALAHERLLTEAEFARTLTGGVAMELPEPVVPPSPVVSFLLGKLLLMAMLLTLAAAAWTWKTYRARPLARIRRAARNARRAARDQMGADALHAHIDALMKHALVLVRAEREATRREKLERASAPRAAGGFAARAASEIDRLAHERDRARAGLEEIHEALRVLALKGTTAEGSLEDTERALAKLDEELELRREAAAEAAAAIR